MSEAARASSFVRSRRFRVSVDEGPEYNAGCTLVLEEAIGGEAIERYQAALMKLPESDRDAIVGRLELGLSYDELAELLGKPSPDAARKAAQRALVRLVDEMKHGR
jgi:RNA polymerase sigma-70 factor (ECF subfamily)